MSFQALADRAAALRDELRDKPVDHRSIAALADLLADVTAAMVIPPADVQDPNDPALQRLSDPNPALYGMRHTQEPVT